MRRKRIKLVCAKCGTVLRWEEDAYPGMIKVEPCPDCLQRMTKEQRLMYERGKADGIQKMSDFIDGCMT